MFKDLYNDQTTYSLHDCVIYDGSAYISIKNNNTTSPETAGWVLLDEYNKALSTYLATERMYLEMEDY